MLGIVDHVPRTHRFSLQPGDRLVLVTDGFLERNAVHVDLPSTLVAASRHPRQFVRELATNVLTATGGNLRDDATVLCIDWHGQDEERSANAGASRACATKP